MKCIIIINFTYRWEKKSSSSPREKGKKKKSTQKLQILLNNNRKKIYREREAYRSTHLWSSWGKLNKSHFLSCFMDMCLLDRFERLCKALLRDPPDMPWPCTKLSRRIEWSIFILRDPCMYFWDESPFWRSSCKIWSTMLPLLLEICIISRRCWIKKARTNYRHIPTHWMK